MNLHFRMYRHDYYIQKVKMALSNPVYHITEYTIYIPMTRAHIMSHISYIFCYAGCWCKKNLYMPTILKFDNKNLKIREWRT